MSCTLASLICAFLWCEKCLPMKNSEKKFHWFWNRQFWNWHLHYEIVKQIFSNNLSSLKKFLKQASLGHNVLSLSKKAAKHFVHSSKCHQVYSCSFGWKNIPEENILILTFLFFSVISCFKKCVLIKYGAETEDDI